MVKGVQAALGYGRASIRAYVHTYPKQSQASCPVCLWFHERATCSRLRAHALMGEWCAWKQGRVEGSKGRATLATDANRPLGPKTDADLWSTCAQLVTACALRSCNWGRTAGVGAVLVQHMDAGAARALPRHQCSSDVAACIWAVELDRAMACEERGYKTALFKLIQPQLSAKNDLLIGAPADNHIAAAIGRVWDACPPCSLLPLARAAPEDLH